jgi:transposase-like protein
MPTLGYLVRGMEITAEMLLEAAVPLACKRYARDDKRLAVRLVMLDGWSYRRAAKSVKASTDAVISWVSETEERLRYAGLQLREDEADGD